jgi:hypothetical protein
MRKLQFILILSIIAGVYSCRYGRPLLAFPGKGYVSVDSLGQKQVSKEWYFPCFRTGVHIGCYGIVRIYDKHNHLIEKEKDKNTWVWQCDASNKDYTKTVDYNTFGRKTVISYLIIRGGWGSATLLDKTVYYTGNKVDSVVVPEGTWKRTVRF